MPFVPPSIAEMTGSADQLFERSEFLVCPVISRNAGYPLGQAGGCLFLWFVSFGQAKEMNAQRQRKTISYAKFRCKLRNN